MPWLEPKKYNNLTSHLDLAPTILQMLGLQTPAELYSNGVYLFGDKTREYAVICQWSKCAYDNTKNITVFSMETYSAGLFEHRDNNYTIVDKKLDKRENADLLEIMKDFSRFLK